MAKFKIQVPEVWEMWAAKRQPFIGDPERPQRASDGVLFGSRYAPRLWLPSGHIRRLDPDAVHVRHRRARLFNDAASEFLENTASAPVTAAPFTMACWGNSDSTTATQTAIQIQDKDAAGARWNLEFDGTNPADELNFNIIAGGLGTSASTTTGYTANTWHHAAAVEASATSHAVYIDGGNSGSSSTSKAPAGADSISVGRAGDSTPNNYFSGLLAEVAVWSVALSAGDVAQFADPVSALLVRPESLVFYCPIIGRYSPEIDVVGGLNLTVTGAVAGAHPRIFYPSPRASNFTPSGGAAGGDGTDFPWGMFISQPVLTGTGVVGY